MALKQMEDLHQLGRVNSALNSRTVNNTVRHQYRVLSDAEKAQMLAFKDLGAAFIEQIEATGQGRELSIARTKIEEAVMWSVKAVTA